MNNATTQMGSGSLFSDSINAKINNSTNVKNMSLLESVSENSSNSMRNFLASNNTVSDLNQHALLNQHDYVIQIKTLGRFSVFVDNKAIDASNRAQSKPLELLRVLIALGGRNVGEVKLCEYLWPEADGDVAHTAFSVTLHRLRKIIGSETLELSDSRLSLNPTQCWVDIWQLERSLGKIKNVLNRDLIDHQAVMDYTNYALNLYNGSFLCNEDEEPWSIPLSQRIQSKMTRTLIEVGNYLESIKRCDLAQSYYQKGIELDELGEEFYYRLMRCYADNDRKVEAAALYQRCEKLFLSTLGIAPSQKLSALFNSLSRRAAVNA